MASESPATPTSAPALLSIVTVLWNGRREAEAFLRAVDDARRDVPFGIEVIAVDNASADGTADAISAGHPDVRLIRNTANLGFAPACNQGLAAASGDFLLLLNPDAEAGPAALRALIAFLREHPRAGAVGCSLLHRDGLPQNSHHRDPSWWSYWGTHSLLSPLLLRASKALSRLHSPRQRVPRRVDWIMGACMMVPRHVYERVGGLDPEYFMYSEDADWCRRIRQAGFEVVHLGWISMVHRQGTSARRSPEFTFRRLYRSLLLYGHKHLSGWDRWALRASIILDLSLRLPLHTMARNGARRDSVHRVLRAYWRDNPGLLEEPAPGSPPA